MNRCTANIFNVQRFSTHDGPGIRTTIFFKGCPLRCAWCHNPESQNAVRQLAYYVSLCKSCGKCVEACPVGAIRMENCRPITDRSRCHVCGKCELACEAGARVVFGSEVAVDALFKHVMRDRRYYGEEGGLTVSGGEPLMQARAVAELLRLVKDAGMHTAVDTCGFVPYHAFEAVLPYTDLFLYDIKAMDAHLHRSWTGRENTRILDNLQRIAAQRFGTIWIRIPLIHDVNDTFAEVDAMLKFLAPMMQRVERVFLLPYHTLGESKREALAMKARDIEPEMHPPTQERLRWIIDRFQNAGYQVTCE